MPNFSNIASFCKPAAASPLSAQADPVTVNSHHAPLPGVSPAGVPPVAPGAASHAARLLQMLRDSSATRLRAAHVHALNERSVDLLAGALELSTDNMSLDEKKRAVAKTSLSAIKHFTAAPRSQYATITAKDLAKVLPIPEDDIEPLTAAMRRAHMRIGMDRYATEKQFAVTFGGVQGLGELCSLIASAAGLATPAVHSGVLTAANILAPALQNSNGARIVLISGFSMGGGSAQLFKAALESRLELSKKPSMVLFDPQLLTKAELAAAYPDAQAPNGRAAPRGLAFTLNYDRDRQPPLMVQMASRGYDASHLVQVELPLKPREAGSADAVDDDASAPHMEEPEPSLLGYHDNEFIWFGDCVYEFCVPTSHRPASRRAPGTAPANREERG